MSALATFDAMMPNGPFHGAIEATTPTGSWTI